MIRLCWLVPLLAGCALRAAELSLLDAINSNVIEFHATGNARDTATARIVNKTDAASTIVIPAGTVLRAADGAGQVTLRTLKTPIAPKDESTAILPTAALAKGAGSEERALTPAAPVPKLAPLIAQFDKQPDLPRPTAQLAVLVLLEDIKWPDWIKLLAANQSVGKSPVQPPTPAQVAQAVDALAFVRLAAPDLKPVLLADDSFKRLALRNPWARSKAMLLYGMTVEDAITGDPSLPPDLGKLLHTAPNDNCPICRQRGKQPEFP